MTVEPADRQARVRDLSPHSPMKFRACCQGSQWLTEKASAQHLTEDITFLYLLGCDLGNRCC